jgi:LAO/AO transport system kinase
LTVPAPTADLARAVRGGDRRALARALTVVERAGPDAAELLAALHSGGRNAATVGITGAPGAGKSTLTDRLIAEVRKAGERVGVLAVDPSSPFSRGAILGDRVRMQSHATDDGVFIRSLASRGHLGGLALAAPHFVRVLDAAGFDWILLETVGVGQVEVEIASHAETTVVVVNPGWGDGVQAAKAGLLEVADVFVVNKADRPGADETVHDLAAIADLAPPRPWRPPVLRTVATTGEGVRSVLDAVRAHRAHLADSGHGAARRRARAEQELRSLVLARLAEQADQRCRGPAFDAAVADVVAGRRDPWTAADDLLA